MAYAKALQGSETNKGDVLESLQLLIQLVPAQAWAEHMHNSGLFNWLIKTLMDDKAPTVILTRIVTLFSRLAINNAALLTQLIAASAASMNTPELELWTGMLDQWWRRVSPLLRYFTLTRSPNGYIYSLITCLSHDNVSLQQWVSHVS